MSESKPVKETEAKTNKNAKSTKKTVKVQNPEANKEKDQNVDIMSRLESLDSFISLTDTQKIMSLGTTSLRTVSELTPIKNLLKNHPKSNKDIKLIGMFTIFPNSHHSGTMINVYSDTNHMIHYLQFADLPRYLWYPVKNLDDLNRFITLYTDTVSELPCKKQKRVKYDLKRNNNFHPIMLERYMVTNTFTDNFVWGPVANDENIMEVVSLMSSFDMATKYYDMMQQYEEVFVLSTVSRYSRSTVTTQISVTGTITDVYYVPDATYCEQIKQINAEIDSDFDEDLPIDVVLFLLPFAAVSQRYHVKNLFDSDNPINTIDDQTLGMVYQLNVGVMSHEDLIALMKKFYEKIQLSGKMKPDNIKKKKKKTIEERDIQGEYMIDLIKNYVTREYIAMMITKDNDIETTCKSKIEQLNDCMSNHSDCSDDSDDQSNVMNSVIKLMTDKGDKKFINKHVLKSWFCTV
jgi:hypothetical protein